jgi:hypothetical protein
MCLMSTVEEEVYSLLRTLRWDLLTIGLHHTGILIHDRQGCELSM